MGTGYEVHRLVVLPEDDLVSILNNLTSNTEVILREGTHTAATQILIPSGLTNVTIRGSEASVINITYSGDNPIAIQAPATDIAFEGFQVVYNGTAGGQTPLFAPIGSGAAVIRRLAVRDVHCDFAAGAITFVRWDGEDIDVYNLLISGCSVYGTNSKGLLRVQLAANRTLENVRVIGNSVDRDTPGGSQVFALYGASGATVEDVVASGNSFRNIQEPLWLDFGSGTCRNFVWSANILKYIDSGNAGCWINGNVSSIDIDGNIFETSGANYCLTLTGSVSQAHISDNLFLNSPGNGLVIGSSVTESSIDNNVVYNCTNDGITCSGDRIKLSGNIVIDSGIYGIEVAGDNCVVEGCYTYSNSNHGFLISGVNTKVTGCYSYLDGDAIGENGFRVTGTRCSLTGCYAVDSGDHGFNIISGASCSLNGCYSIDAGVTSAVATAAGISVSATGDVKISGCFVYNSNDHGISSSGIQVSISDCWVMNAGSAAGDYGIYCSGSNHKVNNCWVDDSYDHGIVLQGGSSTAIGCYVWDAGQTSTQAAYGIYLAALRCSAKNCFVEDSYDTGIVAAGGRNSVIGCTVVDAGSAAGDYGIHLSSTSSHASVCEVYNSYDHGIYVSAEDCSVKTCEVEDAGQAAPVATACGIALNAASYTQVNNNRVKNSEDHGLWLVNSDYVQVNDNYLRSNGDYGLVEDANCDYCLYDGNFSIGNVTGAKSLNGSFRKQGTNSW